MFLFLLFVIPVSIAFALDYWFDIYLPDLIGFQGSDEPIMFLMAAPGIAFLLSIPFYFVRRSLYKAWLTWTGLWAALPVWIVMAQKPHSSMSFDPNPIILSVPYIGGCLVILLVAFVLPLIKNNQERNEARAIALLKYLFIAFVSLFVLGVILFNIFHG